MSELKKCIRCGLPETYETIEFDKNGLCNVCKSAKYKQEKIDWVKRKKLLDQLVEKYRGKYDYDCIVPFSGGKDSTFQLYYLMKEYKLRPLVIRFNHGFLRPKTNENVTRILRKLGVDFIDFQPNWRIVKKLMLEAFVRKTDFCWHCHTGIYSYPLRVAIKFNVPLLFWGEPLAEFSAYYDYLNDEIEYEDEEKFNMSRNLGITADDMYGMINTPEDPIDKRELLPFTYPALKELKAINYCSVCLGSFIPWDHVKQTELIKKELGWEGDALEGVPASINSQCEKIECFMQGARDYIKFIKRGYTRISQICAFHIRNDRMQPEEAVKYQKLEGKRPPSLDVFLEYMGLTEDEFNKIVKATAIPPYDHDFSKAESADKLWDMDLWYREDNREK